jgi:hypothetical protein
MTFFQFYALFGAPLLLLLVGLLVAWLTGFQDAPKSGTRQHHGPAE